MKDKYKFLLDWATGIDIGFYKQHGGASNSIRHIRLFLCPPTEIAERADYIDLMNEEGFDKMKRTTKTILWLAFFMLVFFAIVVLQ